MRILIVDDSPLAVGALRLWLESLGDNEVVGIAADGEHGLALARTNQPDLVIMDLQLPAMNGLDATREIKRLPAPPRVVLTSGYDGPAYRTAAESVGADGFIGKMDVATQLRPLLQRLFPGRGS